MKLNEIVNWAIGKNKKHAEHPTRQERNHEIVWLNAREVIPLVHPDFRVTPDDPKNHIGNRMDRALKHLEANGWMDPPDLSYRDGVIDFGNGRHRVAALLKSGEEWFPANVDKSSLPKLAAKITVKKSKP